MCVLVVHLLSPVLDLLDKDLVLAQTKEIKSSI